MATLPKVIYYNYFELPLPRVQGLVAVPTSAPAAPEGPVGA